MLFVLLYTIKDYDMEACLYICDMCDICIIIQVYVLYAFLVADFSAVSLGRLEYYNMTCFIVYT